MKKKLSIILACVMLAALVLGSVTFVQASTIADLYSKIDASSLKTEISLAGLTSGGAGQNEAIGYTAPTEVVDDASVSGSQLFKYDFGTICYYNGDGNEMDLSGADGLAFRFKTEADITFYGMMNATSATGWFPYIITYISKDGVVTYPSTSAAGYQHTVPAGFDGYVMFTFDKVQFNGSGIGTRIGNKITNYQKDYAVGAYDLTKFTMFEFHPTTAATAAAESFYLGDLYSFKLACADNGATAVKNLHPHFSAVNAVSNISHADANIANSASNINKAFTALVDDASTATIGDKLAKFAIGAVPVTFGDPSGYEGVMVRFKTEAALKISAAEYQKLNLTSTAVTLLMSNFKYITLDGQITAKNGWDAQTIPAGFDGYIMVNLSNAVFDNGTGHPAALDGDALKCTVDDCTNDNCAPTTPLADLGYLTFSFAAADTSDASANIYVGNSYTYTTSTTGLTDGAAEIKGKFAQFDKVDAIYNLAADVTNAAEVANVLTTAADGLTTDLAAGATQGYLAQYVITSDASVCPYIKLSDATNYDGIMYRLKTDVALSSWSIAHTEGGVMAHPASYTLLSLDGTVTPLAYNYSLSIPAGFDGYVMFSFDKLTGAGGGFAGIGSRTSDNKIITDSNWADSGFDLSKLAKMQFAAWATTESDANGTNSYYVGNAYLYKLPAVSDGAADLKALNSDIETIKAINNVSKYADASLVPFTKNDVAPVGLSADGKTVVHALSATASSHYNYIGSLEGVDAVVLRYKTSADASLVALFPMSGRSTSFYPSKATLIDLQGVKTTPEVKDGYIFSIPAGFDGYIMFEFDSVIFAGGVSGTRTGDELSTEDGSKTADLSKVTTANIQPTLQDANAAAGTTQPTFEIGNVYLATLAEPAPSVEPSVVPSAGVSATAGPGQNDPTGAPLMIGVAIAALASASFVLKRKK